MASLTLKGIPDDVMTRLRERAEAERRSLNQQAIRLLETALDEARPSFLEAHEAFLKKHGPPPFDDDFFEGLRSRETGRPSPFEDFEDAEDGA
ncbi:MAG: hypothetical protein ABJF88_14190 [Rhodothermales bacterium]